MIERAQGGVDHRGHYGVCVKVIWSDHFWANFEEDNNLFFAFIGLQLQNIWTLAFYIYQSDIIICEIGKYRVASEKKKLNMMLILLIR